MREASAGSEKWVRNRAEVNGSDAEDHHFGGLDQRGNRLALLQTHLANSICGDNGSDVLTADGERHLSHQPHGLDVSDAADKLISSADPAEVAAALADVAGFPGAIQEFVDLLFRDAMVAAGGLDGADLALIDPLLERGIANAQDLGSFTWRE